MTYTYKLPDVKTMQGQLLGRLLNGQVIDNHSAKDFLDTSCPATHMSKLCVQKGWGAYITKKTFSCKASTGYSSNCKKYLIETNTILELKQNPRVQKFVEMFNQTTKS